MARHPSAGGDDSINSSVPSTGWRLITAKLSLPGGRSVRVAVGRVKMAPVGRDRDLGRVARAGEIRRQAGKGLPQRQLPLIGLVGETRHGSAQPVHDVEKPPVGRESAMARPQTGRDRGEGRGMGNGAGAGRVQSVDKHPVETEVAN